MPVHITKCINISARERDVDEGLHLRGGGVGGGGIRCLYTGLGEGN